MSTSRAPRVSRRGNAAPPATLPGDFYTSHLGVSRRQLERELGGTSLDERDTPIVVYSGVFTWAFVSRRDDHADFKASAFGQWLYAHLIVDALHLDSVRDEAHCLGETATRKA